MTQDYNQNEFLAYTTAKENVSKPRQVVMLYDGIISFVQRAMEAKNNKDFQEHYNFLSKASKIVQGLHQSLDHNNGGDISKILDEFYTMTFSRIMGLFQPSEDESYQSLASDVKKMRDSWEQVDQQNCAREDQSSKAPEASEAYTTADSYPTTDEQAIPPAEEEAIEPVIDTTPSGAGGISVSV